MKNIIVIGSGLAGLTCTLQLLKKGMPVVLLEKTSSLGGNSIKASSGINGAVTEFQPQGDSVELFLNDTIASGKGFCNDDLAGILCANSKSAISWLHDDIGVDLSQVNRLGGHSSARTHRGKGSLPPGFAIVSSLIKALEPYEKNQMLKILKETELTELIKDNIANRVAGIRYSSAGSSFEKIADYVVLATGGFSADSGTNSLLRQYRPDLIDIPSTNGKQTTGDSQKIAFRDMEANLVHMDKIQVHPTGFLNVNAPLEKHKILCGELMRAIGGILVSPLTGNRFVNELKRRDEVTEAIETNCKITSSGSLVPPGTPVSLIVISEQDSQKAASHVKFYASQGLLRKGGLENLNEFIKMLDVQSSLKESDLQRTFEAYNKDILSNKDVFGRPDFGNILDMKEFYYGFITPVIHYTMGGIQINNLGQVINGYSKPIDNLFAIGEVSGGVHGGNRLGGNSLLECVVFGRITSESIINFSNSSK